MLGIVHTARPLRHHPHAHPRQALRNAATAFAAAEFLQWITKLDVAGSSAGGT